MVAATSGRRGEGVFPTRGRAQSEEGRRVWISGVSANVREQQIRRVVQRFGEVDSVDVGFLGGAYALFKDRSAAVDCAKNLDGSNDIEIDGKKVSARIVTPDAYKDAVKNASRGGHRSNQGLAIGAVPNSNGNSAHTNRGSFANGHEDKSDPPWRSGGDEWESGGDDRTSDRKSDGEALVHSIQNLVQARNSHRMNKNYEKADEIREQLFRMGVRVEDKELTWTGPKGLSGIVQRVTFPPRQDNRQASRQSRTSPARADGGANNGRRVIIKRNANSAHLGHEQRARGRSGSPKVENNDEATSERRSPSRSPRRTGKRGQGHQGSRVEETTRSASQSPRRAAAAAAAVSGVLNPGRHDEEPLSPRRKRNRVGDGGRDSPTLGRRSRSPSRRRGSPDPFRQRRRRSGSRHSDRRPSRSLSRSRSPRRSLSKRSRSRRSRSSASSRNDRGRSRSPVRRTSPESDEAPCYEASPRSRSVSRGGGKAGNRHQGRSVQPGAVEVASQVGKGITLCPSTHKDTSITEQTEPDRHKSMSSDALDANPKDCPGSAGINNACDDDLAKEAHVERKQKDGDSVVNINARPVEQLAPETSIEASSIDSTIGAPKIQSPPSNEGTAQAKQSAAETQKHSNITSSEAPKAKSLVPNTVETQGKTQVDSSFAAKVVAATDAGAEVPRVSQAEIAETEATAKGEVKDEQRNDRLSAHGSPGLGVLAVPQAANDCQAPFQRSKHGSSDVCIVPAPNNVAALQVTGDSLHDRRLNEGLQPMGLQGAESMVVVALNFQGKKKLVRHLSSTRVGEIVVLHPTLQQAARRPLVVVDCDGFEIGRELTLGFLARQAAAAPVSGGPLELTLQVDEWAD